jgi:hypothetical protein
MLSVTVKTIKTFGTTDSMNPSWYSFFELLALASGLCHGSVDFQVTGTHAACCYNLLQLPIRLRLRLI